MSEQIQKVDLQLAVHHPVNLQPLLEYGVALVDGMYWVNWKVTESGQDALERKMVHERDFHRTLVPLVIIFTFRQDKRGRIFGLRVYVELCAEGKRAVQFQQIGTNTVHVMLGWVSGYSEDSVVEKAKMLVFKVNDHSLNQVEKNIGIEVEPFRLFACSLSRFRGLGDASVFRVEDFFPEDEQPKGAKISERFDRQDLEVSVAVDRPRGLVQWLEHWYRQCKTHLLES